MPLCSAEAHGEWGCSVEKVAAGAVEAQFLGRWGSFIPKVFKHRLDEVIFFFFNLGNE